MEAIKIISDVLEYILAGPKKIKAAHCAAWGLANELVVISKQAYAILIFIVVTAKAAHS